MRLFKNVLSLVFDSVQSCVGFQEYNVMQEMKLDINYMTLSASIQPDQQLKLTNDCSLKVNALEWNQLLFDLPIPGFSKRIEHLPFRFLHFYNASGVQYIYPDTIEQLAVLDSPYRVICSCDCLCKFDQLLVWCLEYGILLDRLIPTRVQLQAWITNRLSRCVGTDSKLSHDQQNEHFVVLIRTP